MPPASGAPASPSSPPPAENRPHQDAPHPHALAPDSHADADPALPMRIAFIGNPNTGKTTLFNRLSGLRHKTSNFPGTTLEARIGRVRREAASIKSILAAAPDCCDDAASAPPTAPKAETGGPPDIELIDLPGIYSLELDQTEAAICRSVLAGETAPRGGRVESPDGVCVVLDATNLGRNLLLAGETLRRRLPTLIVVNMIDLARKRGLSINREQLAEMLGCPVVIVSARTGEGLDELREAIAHPRVSTRTPPGDVDGLHRWADSVYAAAGELSDPEAARDTAADRLDRVFTHPVLGLISFFVVMGALFYVLFRLAQYPMEWIGAFFDGDSELLAAWQPEWLQHVLGGGLKGVIQGVMPAGALRDLLADGVVGGIGSTVVFIPQICLLFFLISLLEDTGYLARAAFVADRVLRPFGLPGHAFVPLLSSHACALPGIMATRAIPDRRERLATILVAPFMTCSARLPVYVLVTSILFVGSPGYAALAFIGCYMLGMLAGVISALLARRTLLRGSSRPMVLELPSYKFPSIRTALITTFDRGVTFLRSAGTNIMMICIVLWWLGSYPHVAPPPKVAEMKHAAQTLADSLPPRPSEPDGDAEQDAAASTEPAAALTPLPSAPDSELSARWEEVDRLNSEADSLQASDAKERSFMGRAGKAVQPIFQPLGFDWKLTVGVLTSFAAREVFGATMGVVLAGDEDFENVGVVERLRTATRDDGVTPVFDRPACWSILVFFVLAMQCLPTLAVTARESGHVKWAILQFAWMSVLAYLGGLIAYQLAA